MYFLCYSLSYINTCPFSFNWTFSHIQRPIRISEIFGACCLTPRRRIFLPIQVTKGSNSRVVSIRTQFLASFLFVQQIPETEPAFSIFFAQCVHVAFKGLVTLPLIPSVELSLERLTTHIYHYNNSSRILEI